MRSRLAFGVLLVTAGVLIGWFTSLAAVPLPAAPAKDDKKAISDDRDDLSAKLFQRVSLDKPFDNTPLKDVLEFLGEKYELTILIDGKSFPQDQPVAVALQAEDAVLTRQISVPVMKNVRLATILKQVADQIDSVYLLYPDHIKIVGASRAFTLTNPPVRDYQPEGDDPGTETFNEIVRSIPLVNAHFKEVTLLDALRDVELRTNRTIVLASQASEKAKTSITARFTNVPVDTAVATLAESAGLKMARKGNVLLVTTAERAKEFAPPPVSQFMFGMGGFGTATAEHQQLEELKKKVADLEKTIEELKKK